MSDDEFEDEPSVELDEEDLDDDLDDEDLADDLDVDLDLDDVARRRRPRRRGRGRRRPGDPGPVVTDDTASEATTTTDDEDDDDVVDLDEELHPDDVEEPLDVLLQERTASATLEDDEEELEDEELDGDDRGEGPTPDRAAPRRRVPLPVLLPRPAPPTSSPTRSGSSAATAPELTPARQRFSWARLGLALAAGVVAGFCFPPFDLGALVVVPVAAALGVARRPPVARGALRARVRRRVATASCSSGCGTSAPSRSCRSSA